MANRRRYGNWKRQPSVTETFPVETRQLDDIPREVWLRRHQARQLAYEAALEVAGGDADRLAIEDDGTITILNQPVRRGLDA